jgi:hypothetical protein
VDVFSKFEMLSIFQNPVCYTPVSITVMEVIVALLSLYAKMFSVSCCSAALHCALQNDMFTFPEQVGGLSKGLKQRAGEDQCETTKLGFKAEVLDGLARLDIAVQELSGSMEAKDLQGIDGSDCFLKCSVASCRQWLLCIRCFFERAVVFAVDGGVKVLEARADDLEASVPRWDAAFHEGKIDEGFASARLLNNKNRSKINPTVRLLQSVLETLKHGVFKSIDSTKYQVELGMATKACKLAQDYMLVVAALNTVLVTRMPDLEKLFFLSRRARLHNISNHVRSTSSFGV